MIEYTVQVTSDRTEWYLNGKLHREDGPAVTNSDGYKVWYLNGKRHREDGPAIEHNHVEKMWFLNGIQVTEADVMSPTKEMTIAELEAVLGHKVKVIK